MAYMSQNERFSGLGMRAGEKLDMIGMRKIHDFLQLLRDRYAVFHRFFCGTRMVWWRLGQRANEKKSAERRKNDPNRCVWGWGGGGTATAWVSCGCGALNRVVQGSPGLSDCARIALSVSCS